MSRPKVVSPAAWQAARDKLLVKEKKATRLLDALAAERRRLPMVRIAKKYSFTGPDGKASLADLFDGRSQLILYHFMFAPSVHGWPDAGCPGCSYFADSIGRTEHLHARDVTLALVSAAPLPNIERYRKRMGWTLPWYSSAESDFNRDFGLTTDNGETFGFSVFLRDGKNIFRTYFTQARGVETMTDIPLLDATPFGRQESWEDSPPGWPQDPTYSWMRRHDEYATAGKKPKSRKK